jgi:hypothetical protein
MMNSSDFDEQAAKADLKGKALADSLGNSGSSAGIKMSDGFRKGTKGMSGVFSSLANEANSLGLPFANTFSKISQSIEQTTTRTGKLTASLAGIGKISLFAGIAGGVAAAGEGVKLWDGYEKALVAVNSSVKNAGGNVQAFDTQMSHLAGSAKLFTKTDIAGSLANLTVATNQPTKALSMMTLVENMAAHQHETLGAATDQLDHILGGSSRTLLSLGINANVSSGRMHSLQQDEESLQKAQQNLSGVQDKHNAGMLEGAGYIATYKNAVLSVRDAQLNLNTAQTSTNGILNILNQRFQGSATMLGHTFAGQVQEARTSLTNLGISFGGEVVKGIQHLEIILADTVNWLEKFKVVAIALGVIIGGPLVAGVFIYLGSIFIRISTYILTLGNTVNTFGMKAKAAATGPAALATAVNQLSASLTPADEALVTAGTTATETATQIKNLQLSFIEAGDAAQGTLFSLAAFDTALDTTATDAELAGTAMRGAFTDLLGPIGIAVTAIGAVVTAFGLLQTHAASAFAVVNKTPIPDQWQNAYGNYFQQGQIGGMGQSMKKWGQAENAIAGSGNKPTYGWKTESAADIATGAFKGDKTRKDPSWTQGAGEMRDRADEYAALTAPTQVWQQTGVTGTTPAQKKSMAAYLTALDEYTKVMGMSSKQQKAWIAQQMKNYDLLYGVTPTSMPSIPGAPGTPAGAGSQEDPRMQKFWSMQGQMQQSLQTGTIQSLRPQLQTGAVNAAGVPVAQPLTHADYADAKSTNAFFNKMTAEVSLLWKDGLHAQSNALLATYNANLKYYGSLEADLKQTGINVDIQNANTQYQDQTAILTDLWTQATQKITDKSSVSTAKSAASLDLANDKNQEAVDKLGERGLYGLNLIAQEMKVQLDVITTKWTAKVDAASTHVATTQQTGNAAVAAAKLHMDTVQKTGDISAFAMNKINAIAQKSGSTLAQAEAGTKLGTKQYTAVKAEYLADRAYAQAQAIANKHNATAQAQLAAIKAGAAAAEGKQNRLIAIEQAKANTEFAGSGVHIEITGVNPTDATAIGAAVSWNLRTKVPK